VQAGPDAPAGEVERRDAPAGDVERRGAPAGDDRRRQRHRRP
jgi:hypothetical protein